MRVRLTADALSDLETFKHAAGQFDGTYEFVVRRLPFVIVYQLDVGDEDEVIVLRVYHVRQSRHGR
jgi:plasmid stabilization system protein ParE